MPSCALHNIFLKAVFVAFVCDVIFHAMFFFIAKNANSALHLRKQKCFQE